MKFTEQLPTLTYTGVSIVDISVRFNALKSAKNYYSFFYEYALRDGDTAERTSYDLYGTHDYWWILYAINDVIDPFYDWLMTDEEVGEYANLAYSDMNDIHHYADESSKTYSCLGYNQDIVANTRTQCISLGGVWEFNKDSILIFNQNNAQGTLLPVTNLEYEIDKNQEKRRISVVPVEHIGQIYGDLNREVTAMKNLQNARGRK